MAAGAFKVFNGAKGALGSAGIDLSTGTFRLVLVKSGTALSAATAGSTKASMSTNGVTFFASLGNYSASGKVMTNVSWRASNAAYVFDAADWSLSQTAALSKIWQAMVVRSGGWPVAYCCLSTTAFDLESGNKLTVAFNAAGIFTLT